MAQKHTWTFEYTVLAVRTGVERQLAYHKAKVAEWTDAEKRCEGEAQRSITLTQGYATVEGKSTIVARPQLDEAKMQALYEAQNHRQEHQAKAEQYDLWASVLAVERDARMLPLDYDDVVYFGLQADLQRGPSHPAPVKQFG